MIMFGYNRSLQTVADHAFTCQDGCMELNVMSQFLMFLHFLPIVFASDCTVSENRILFVLFYHLSSLP